MDKIFNLMQAAEAMNGRLVNCDGNTLISGVCKDTRELKSGDLFFALIGESDGHRFVEAAFKGGAVCCVVNASSSYPDNIPVIQVENTGKALLDLARAYRKALAVPVVAVTGSVGKTSTRDMLGSVLSQKYKTLVNEKNYNNEIGVPMTLFGLSKTHEIAVVEMGMNHFGELSRITAAALPNTAVITNIGLSHIENLGDRDGILKAKLEVLEGLSADGTVFMCGDDDKLWGVKGTLDFETVYCGIKNRECDLVADDIILNADGSTFSFTYEGKKHTVTITVPGEHHIYNALIGIGVGLKYKLSLEEIINGIKSFKPTGMRQAEVSIGEYTVIKDCYNASPASMKSGMSILSLSDKGARKVAVLGDMLELGSISDEAHYETGTLVPEYKIDCLITVGERAVRIADGAIAAGMNPKSVFSFKDKESLYKSLYDIIQKDDLILLKASRYMQLEKIVEFMEKTEG